MTARDDVAALLIKSVLNHLQTKYKSRFALDVGEVAGHKSKGRVHLLSSDCRIENWGKTNYCNSRGCRILQFGINDNK